jgi:hypothetical protein
MGNIHITLTQPVATSVQIKPRNTVVSTVQIGPRPRLLLDDLIDVNASDPDNGETLVYDEATHEYIVKPIVVDSNNITSIQGGGF